MVTVTLAIPEAPLAWLLAFLFVLLLALAWFLGAAVIRKLIA